MHILSVWLCTITFIVLYCSSVCRQYVFYSTGRLQTCSTWYLYLSSQYLYLYSYLRLGYLYLRPESLTFCCFVNNCEHFDIISTDNWVIYSHLFHKKANSKQPYLSMRLYFFSIRVAHNGSITKRSIFSYIGNCILDMYLQWKQGTCTCTCTWRQSTWYISGRL